jgi:hypothetical protein
LCVLLSGVAQDGAGCHVPHPLACARRNVPLERGTEFLGFLRGTVNTSHTHTVIVYPPIDLLCMCRMMGHLIRHIHNRDLATENMMTGYVRLRFILDKFPKTISKMIAKFATMDLRIPRGGATLQLATEVRSYKCACRST